MEPSLNQPRMFVVVVVMSALFSIPALYLMNQEVPMSGWQEFALNWPMALFIGGLFSGVVIHLAAILLGGTLPKWFWQSA